MLCFCWMKNVNINRCISLHCRLSINTLIVYNTAECMRTWKDDIESCRLLGVVRSFVHGCLALVALLHREDKASAIFNIRNIHAQAEQRGESWVQLVSGVISTDADEPTSVFRLLEVTCECPGLGLQLRGVIGAIGYDCARGIINSEYGYPKPVVCVITHTRAPYRISIDFHVSDFPKIACLGIPFLHVHIRLRADVTSVCVTKQSC